jgi:hypothetical protein
MRPDLLRFAKRWSDLDDEVWMQLVDDSAVILGH